MVKRIFFALGALLVNSWVLADSWTGKDKELHAAAGAAIGAAATAATGRPAVGCGAAALAGVVKEAYDAKHRGDVSFKDFAVTAFVGCITAHGTGWAIGRNSLTYSHRF